MYCTSRQWLCKGGSHSDIIWISPLSRRAHTQECGGAELAEHNHNQYSLFRSQNLSLNHSRITNQKQCRKMIWRNIRAKLSKKSGMPKEKKNEYVIRAVSLWATETDKFYSACMEIRVCFVFYHGWRMQNTIVTLPAWPYIPAKLYVIVCHVCGLVGD